MTQSATGKIKASRVNNLDASTYIGPAGQLWYDVNTGVLRLGDGSTPGGIITGGGGGTPSGPTQSIQFNNNGSFGGTSSLTFNPTANVLSIFGNVTANNFIGNGSQLTGIPPSLTFITSNIANLQAGMPLNVAAVYGNSQYPGGIFTIYQPVLPETLTVTNFWTSSGSTSKNAYADYSNNVINSSNVSLTLSSTNTFTIQNTDNIIIGNTIITGANLASIGINGIGGTYSIPAALIGNTVEISNSSPVQVNLTTLAGGPFNAVGNTLSTIAPIPFSISNLTASFANITVTPGLGNQPVQYDVTIGNGTALTGNIIISGAANLTANVGNILVGNTANINSIAGNFVVTANFTGNGLYGAGTTTASANVPLAKVIQTTPMFIKSTPTAANPAFVPTDANFGNNWVPAPGLPGNAQGITTDWNNPVSQFYWIAIPDADYWSYTPYNTNPVNPGPNLYFNYDTPIGTVNAGFYAAWGNGTANFGGGGGNILIGNVPYVALGFSQFANIQNPGPTPNVFIYVSTSDTGG